MRDNVIPHDKWQFDEDVTNVFNDMLQRSIPQYEVMREAVYNLACQYIQPHTGVVSLGASRGEDVAKLIETYALKNRFHLTDISDPMLDVLQKRFEHYININSVAVKKCDLRHDYPLADSSVTLCILTLQFTPIEYRQKIMQRIYDNLLPNGVLILVEKVLGSTSCIDDVLINLYYELKKHNGYNEEQIQRKRMSLEGVLVPVTASWNEELMRMAGFRAIDCFWRWMNFSGWIAIKS